jgi:hypothetical protein
MDMKRGAASIINQAERPPSPSVIRYRIRGIEGRITRSDNVITDQNSQVFNALRRANMDRT